MVSLLSSQGVVLAQSNIPLGTWRIHTSYHNIKSLAVGDQKIYAAARNGVMMLDQSDNSMTTYSKLDGLQGTSISVINYDRPSRLLFIAYESGKFDVIGSDGTITGFDPVGTSGINGAKRINDIYFHDETAFLASAYGVLIFDLKRLQIRETWRDIGRNGATLEVLQSAVRADSIFLATKSGVLAGDLSSNLLDFKHWKRFDAGDFSGAVEGIAAFNDDVYAVVNNTGAFRYGSGGWMKESYLQDVVFNSLNANSDHLIIAEQKGIWSLSSDQTLSQIVAEAIEMPQFALEDATGKVWVGDGRNGLVSIVPGSFVSYIPNSPTNNTTFHLTYHAGKMYGVAGGYNAAGQPLGNPGNIDVFNSGVWSRQYLQIQDITELVFGDPQEKQYSSSYGYGLEVQDGTGNELFYNEENSPLINTAPPGRSVNVTSLAADKDGVWVANYGANLPLHFLNQEGGWESFSFPQSSSRFPLQLATDQERNVWMLLDPAKGGGILVYDKMGQQLAYLTDVAGAGGLPSKSVRSVAIDRDGLVWVGTDAGVAFFIDPAGIFLPVINAVKPIFESRFLLRDEKVTAVAVDGGNRKWFGTERGLWLFSPNAEEMIYYFTSENSPLLSNNIIDIETDDKSGEVFFATEEGLISFRADATESNASFESVKVFPNPVTANFVGSVGISGLATDATVKITDIGGKLVWQTQANGGTASWKVQDERGARVPTGIYLVFAVTRDGSESIVAKLAVVE